MSLISLRSDDGTLRRRVYRRRDLVCKYTYGISLFHASTPERRVVTHTVKITRPAGPVPIFYEIYAIHPAHKVG